MARWTREWALNTPAVFRLVAAAFIAMSIYFAFAPISNQLGTIAAYAYGIVGFGLIGVLCVSLRLEFEDQRRRYAFCLRKLDAASRAARRARNPAINTPRVRARGKTARLMDRTASGAAERRSSAGAVW
jgi:hypothetical protein